MKNSYLYLAILLGLTIFLVLTFVVLLFKENKKGRWKGKFSQQLAPREDFYCLKSSLKQISDGFYVAQILFTNKKDCALTAQKETPRHISEE